MCSSIECISSISSTVGTESSHSITPASVMIGNETLPTTTTVASPVARPRRHRLNLGLFQPNDWNRLHVPWNRWMPSAMLATM
jgi:hypothetical protein